MALQIWTALDDPPYISRYVFNTQITQAAHRSFVLTGSVIYYPQWKTWDIFMSTENYIQND